MIFKRIILSTFFCTFFTLSVFSQKPTNELLNEAKITAQKEGKAIFIKFEASWCGWCHKMTKDMKANKTKDFFNNNYVIVPVVVKESAKNKNLENPGSTELLKKYGGDKAGLPFWVILDANLKLITNSYNDKNQNLGGPASAEEVAAFIGKIKKTAKHISEKDIENIKNQFTLKK
ncbi:thioredoxin family protein [Polaribacter batillariae]|uniref:Thioredoxin family protein n=1 Tax=Polaribacter batillariae TaxID=2808900 RepID=A0ABX7SUS2_9FLAO|nr:thioredoxin family protein [Polaribacter batillariae]QTD37987.1 thioredoxin family protein [Polaribacter batillariae]